MNFLWFKKFLIHSPALRVQKEDNKALFNDCKLIFHLLFRALGIDSIYSSSLFGIL
jgi:hypothetical protein